MKPHARSKQSWRKAYGQSPVAMLSWMALIAMFSTISVSILWEMYGMPHRVAQDAENETYVYPVYVFDFDSVMEERELALEDYGYEPQTSGVERRSNLTLQEFWDLYDAKWPVIVTDVMNSWPAAKWTKEMLNKTYAEERVVMKAVKGTLKDAQGLSLPLHLFVSHVSISNPHYWTYLEDELFITTRPELRQQVPQSIYTQEDFFQQFPAEVRPWDCMLLWGTAHSRSSLHIDPYNWTGTNAVIYGTKKWKLFPPGQDHLLYTFPDAKCGFPLECKKYNSPVDAFAPESELQQFPLFKSAKYIEVEQKAGELLFIPTGWFHQAYNAKETLAISGQMMNRNNYRYVLEEILKAGNLRRKHLPGGFHNLLPPDQVTIFMSLLPKKILERGKQHTVAYLKEINEKKDIVNKPLE